MLRPESAKDLLVLGIPIADVQSESQRLLRYPDAPVKVALAGVTVDVRCHLDLVRSGPKPNSYNNVQELVTTRSF